MRERASTVRGARRRPRMSSSRRLPVRLHLKSSDNRQPTRATRRKIGGRSGCLFWCASLTCRLFRLRFGEKFRESGEKHFSFFGGERVPTGRRGVLLHKFL